MVRRPADAVGMTVMALVVSVPVVLAAYVGLSMPKYEWIATILPLALVLGAPFAFVVGGFAGPRLGRRVAALFTRGQREKHTAVQSSDMAQVPVNESVTITPPAASLGIGTSPPNVLLISAVENVKVKEALSLTCNVVVASTSAQAIGLLRTAATRKVVFDTSAILEGNLARELLAAARNAVGFRQIYFVDLELPEMTGMELIKDLRRQYRFVRPEEFEALALEFMRER